MGGEPGVGTSGIFGLPHADPKGRQLGGHDGPRCLSNQSLRTLESRTSSDLEDSTHVPILTSR
jgi:hypothetical protein